MVVRMTDAQTFVNNGATVVVTQGGVMSVKLMASEPTPEDIWYKETGIIMPLSMPTTLL